MAASESKVVYGNDGNDDDFNVIIGNIHDTAELLISKFKLMLDQVDKHDHTHMPGWERFGIDFPNYIGSVLNYYEERNFRCSYIIYPTLQNNIVIRPITFHFTRNSLKFTNVKYFHTGGCFLEFIDCSISDSPDPYVFRNVRNAFNYSFKHEKEMPNLA